MSKNLKYFIVDILMLVAIILASKEYLPEKYIILCPFFYCILMNYRHVSYWHADKSEDPQSEDPQCSKSADPQ